MSNKDFQILDDCLNYLKEIGKEEDSNYLNYLKQFGEINNIECIKWYFSNSKYYISQEDIRKYYLPQDNINYHYGEKILKKLGYDIEKFSREEILEYGKLWIIMNRGRNE